MNIKQMVKCSLASLRDVATNTTRITLAPKETTTSEVSTCCMKSMRVNSKPTQSPSTISSNDLNEGYDYFTIETKPTPLTVQVDGDHYKKMKIQPAEYNYANNIPFLEGNIIKYISRWRNKNGVADLKKAIHCIELLIELEQKGTK